MYKIIYTSTKGTNRKAATKMMNADDIKKGIECMKAQKKSLEKEMLDLKTHLVRGIYDMGSEELIMVANRIAYLEKRIEAGRAKIDLAELIVR